MKKVYILEIALEQGAINRIMFDDIEQANRELDKLKAKMGTRYSKNSEEIIELNGPAEKYCVVAGRVMSAAVVDKYEHESIQGETNKELAKFNNEAWIEQTKMIIDAGLGDYIKK